MRKLLFIFIFLISLVSVSATITYNDDDTRVYVSFDDDDISGGVPDDISFYNITLRKTGLTHNQTGIFNEASLFASGDNVTVDRGDYIPSPRFTMNAWINPSSANSELFSNMDGVTENGFISYYRGLDSKLQFTYDTQCDGSWDATLFSNDRLSLNEWTFVTFIFNSSGASIFVNGTYDNSNSVSGDGSICDTGYPLSIGIRQKQNNLFTGLMDEVSIWNETLGTKDISYLYNSGSPTSVQQFPFEHAPQPPSFIYPTPDDFARNNTNITINVSCADGRVNLWFNESEVIVNVSSPAEYSTDLSSSDSFLYTANCRNATMTNFFSANVTRNWTYDIDSPVISVGGGSEFNLLNLTNFNPYDNDFLVNLTFTDNYDLFGFLFNITKNAVNIYYNKSNISLSGDEANWSKLINTSEWVAGFYDIEVTAVDSHTKLEIGSYDVIKSPNKLEFDTEEGLNIVVESVDDSVVDVVKLKDRYNFEFDFVDGKSASRSFNLRSDKKIYYRADSLFDAHFVIYNGGGQGNWIDFEGVLSDYTVQKISDYDYSIIFDSMPKSVLFESLGGLNSQSLFLKWYKGTYNIFAPNVEINQSINISINLTRDASQEINATLFYDGTLYDNVSTAHNANNWFFIQEVLANETPKTAEFYWNFTFNQTGVDGFQFNISGNQSVFNWSVFNCSENGTLTFNIYREDFPANYINASLDLEVEHWVTTQASSHILNVELTGNYTYSLCILPINQTINTNIYAQYETEDAFTHRYFLFDYVINETKRNISMYNFNETDDKSDLKITTRYADNYQYFSNVVAKLQRLYLGEGVWRTVQMDRSGDFGSVSFNIIEESVDYRISYYDEDNNLLKETESLKFICSSGVCELDQLLDPYDASVASSDIDVVVSIDNITKIITIDWTDPQSNNNKVEVRVSKETLTGTVDICDVFQTGSSGTVNCDASAYTGSVYVSVLSSNSPYTPMYSTWVLLTRGLLSSLIPKADATIWSFGIMVTVIGVGLFSPMASVISAIIGLITIMFLGLFSPITLTFVIIAVVMGIAIGIKVRA